MADLLQDLRYGLRSLGRRPSFTAVALLTLVLGIGANTAIFSLVRGILLKPLPYEAPERLVRIFETTPAKPEDTVYPANFLEWRNQTRSFEGLAGFAPVVYAVAGNDKPERVNGASVTANLFSVLGVRAAHGQAFYPPAEDLVGEKVVVLTDGYWQRRFGGDPSAVGQHLKMDGEAYRILGVMPKGFEQFMYNAELFVPAPKEIPEIFNFRNEPTERLWWGFLSVIGRLKPGVSREAAQAEMDTIARRRQQDEPVANQDRGIALVPLHEDLVGDVRPALVLLMGAVGLVLLIACVNIANLLFARGAERYREMALRTALGASRQRIVRQLLTESVVLSFAAGLLGLLLAYGGVRLLVRLSPPDTPRTSGIGLDAGVLVFTLVISLLTAFLFGLLPALQASRPNQASVLKEGGRSSSGTRARRFTRSVLVVLEVAFALVLMIGAGLLMKSFVRLQDVEPGFDPKNLLTLQISLLPSNYPDEVDQIAFFQRLLARIETLPGVESAAAALNIPLSGDDRAQPFSIEGRPDPEAGERPRDGYQIVSPDYFETMKIPLIGGRLFTAADADGATGAAIISEEMARRYWPDQDPIGRRITYHKPDDPEAKWLTIVGIVGNVKHTGLDQPPRAEVFMTRSRWPQPAMGVLVRTKMDPASLIEQVRREVAQIDPEQPIDSILPMEERLATTVSRPRFVLSLIGIFAALALTLAVVGIYGVMAYSVGQRLQEIGIRMALGAERSTVIGMVIRDGMLLAILGVGGGLLAAYALTRVMAKLLFEVSVRDFATFAGVSVVLLTVALLANAIPAFQASRVSPVRALRAE